MKQILLILFTAGLILRGFASDLIVGEAFPLIALPLIEQGGDGEKLWSLADFRGKKTVVHIFAGW
jgi:hypothetical protein